MDGKVEEKNYQEDKEGDVGTGGGEVHCNTSLHNSPLLAVVMCRLLLSLTTSHYNSLYINIMPQHVFTVKDMCNNAASLRHRQGPTETENTDLRKVTKACTQEASY